MKFWTLFAALSLSAICAPGIAEQYTVNSIAVTSGADACTSNPLGGINPVPKWIQTTMTLKDPAGRFDYAPDPLTVKAYSTGDYAYASAGTGNALIGQGGAKMAISFSLSTNSQANSTLGVAQTSGAGTSQMKCADKVDDGSSYVITLGVPVASTIIGNGIVVQDSTAAVSGASAGASASWSITGPKTNLNNSSQGSNFSVNVPAGTYTLTLNTQTSAYAPGGMPIYYASAPQGVANAILSGAFAIKPQ